MKCSQCGFESPEGFTFCGKCGASLAPSCPKCGTTNPPGFAFCGKCGTPLTAQSQLTTADLDHLRLYLPPQLTEELHFDLVSPAPHLLGECTAHLAKLLEISCTHLPAYLVEQLMRDPTPGQAGGQFVDGTLLFADISGFTSMSEKLSQIGHEGAEEITAIVNRYFVAMLAILKEHQGSLVKFGGDALLGVFQEPNSATRATQAAIQMQEAMTAFAQTETSQGIFELRVKVAVHKGRFFAAYIGTSKSMEYALFGSDVNATAQIESAAIAGQVLLDEPTRQAISVSYRSEPAPQGGPFRVITQIESIMPMALSSFLSLPYLAEPTVDSLKRAVELLDTITPYLPAGLLARIAGRPDAISLGGEHRLVAVLFANIHGLGEIVDKLGVGQEARIIETINGCFMAMGKAIHRFGGVINKIDLYDHGDKLLAFFGAPLAHEDDAERAVRAALALQESLNQAAPSLPDMPDLCLTLQIGISYGFTFAGYVGTSWRHEYTVMGDEVNLGARLMSASTPGKIVISSDIRLKIRALFEMTARGEVKLKGKHDPVPIFEVTGIRSMPDPVRGLQDMYSPMVGRDDEWQQLNTVIEHLTNRQGHLVSIVGEVGLGKSRLVAEMVQKTRATVQWIQGRCLSFTESVSYWPFQEIARQMAGIKADDTRAEGYNKLRLLLDQRLGPQAALSSLPYLASFMDLSFDDTQLDHMDAQALQRQIFVTLRSLVEAYVHDTNTTFQTDAQAPSGPLVLVFEDLHWVDQASVELLKYLMPLVGRMPLLLLLLYRPERTGRCWEIHQAIEREFAHYFTEITLAPLSIEDSQRVLDNLVQLDNWLPGIREMILDRSEGNPLYMEEVLRTLIEDHILVRNAQNAWIFAEKVKNLRVPDTIQGVMTTRLDQLPESSRRAAQTASVIGRIFALDILDHVRTRNRSTARDHANQDIERLQQYEIVRETQRIPELIYIFEHTLMHQVCYKNLPARIRRQYHRQIAAYLEQNRSVGRSKAEGHYPVIAYHAFAGQDWPRALRYLTLAGQRAQRLYANQDAIAHFSQAQQSAENLSSVETVEDRRIIHTALGELYVTTSQYEQAQEHLEKALTMAIERGDCDTQAHICRLFARLYEYRGEYDTAFEWIEKGLASLYDDGASCPRETAETAELWITAGLIHNRRGNREQAFEHGEQAEHIAKTLNKPAVQARAKNLLGYVTRLQGDNIQATDHFTRAIQLYTEAGDLGGQATAHNQLAAAQFELGQWQKAREDYGLASQLFDQIGDVYHRAFADNNLGEIALHQGQLDEALVLFQTALETLERLGVSAYVQGVLHMNLGYTFIRGREMDQAQEHLEISRALFREAQAKEFLAELYDYMAQMSLLSQDLEQAKSFGQMALDLAEEASMPAGKARALHVLGQAALVEGRLDDAEQQLIESQTLFDQLGDEYHQARCTLSLTELYIAQSKPDRAETTLERCKVVFERLHAALDQEQARALQSQINTLNPD